MKRWLIIVSILLAASIEGNFWLAGELREERDRAERATVGGKQHTGNVENSNEPSAHEGVPADLKKTKHKMARQQKRLLAALRKAEETMGRSAKRHHPLGGGSILVPTGASLVDVRRLPPSSDLPGVVVLWERGPNGARGSGLNVWQSPQTSGTPTDWRLIFRIEMSAPRGTVHVGPPGAEQTETSVTRAITSFETGDATGDGRPDILVLEGGVGRRACGTWRLVALRGTRIESIFTRQGCELNLEIHRSTLRVEAPLHRGRRKHDHSGLFRQTWLRWTGTSWDPARSRIIQRD